MTRGLSVRARLLLASVGAVTLALAIGVTAFNVFLGQRLNDSATNTAKAQAEAELSSLEVKNGRLLSPEGPDEAAVSTLTWVFEGTRVLESPRTTAELNDAAASHAGAPEGHSDVAESARLYVLPVEQDGRRYGTVVAAVQLGAYRETAQTALIGSLALAAMLLVAFTALSWWMLGRALLPVQRMAESAAQWSRNDLDQRFALGEPRDEFTRLGATLDELLERIAESLRHEQRLTAELSHELRTPLARVKGETELLLGRPRTQAEQTTALNEIAQSVEEMTSTIDALLAAARHEAGLSHATTDLREVVADAASGIASETVNVDVLVPPSPVNVAVERELLARMLQPLTDNARRYGETSVALELTRDTTTAYVRVIDDGPGVTADEAESVFAPGWRGSAATDTDGAGLGLALARRLARSVGGDVTVTPSDRGGRFEIAIPVRN